MNPPIIYTTNYDWGIELIVDNIKKKYFKIACLKNILEAQHGAKVIIKFHGDFSAPEEIVLTQKDYERRMKLENPLDVQLRSNLLGKSILFLGYSLRDININFVLNKHADQYGLENLPVSYLITFDKYVNDTWVKELESKNVQIISVAGATELFELIKILNKEVYINYSKQEIHSIFTSQPSEVLLKNELNNLKEFWQESSFSDEEKGQKITKTIVRKKIPKDLEEELIKLLKEIISSDGFIKSKEAVINIFHYLGLSHDKHIDLAIEFMELTSIDELNWGTIPKPSITDVISTIEMTFKRELTVLIIYLYLLKCYESKRILSFEHADRIFYWFKHCRYEEFFNSWGDKLPKEGQVELLEHFLQQHPPVLRNRFNSAFIGGQPTGSEITEYFLKLMPKRK